MCQRYRFGSLLMLGFMAVGLLAGCADKPVNESARLEQQDSAEAVQIKAWLLEASDLAGSAIDVDLDGDRAVLSGFVETSEQRERAESIVREHAQIDTVENNITVK